MICGIDPGLGGALAILDQDGALVALHDTPTLTLSTNRGTRQEYDLPGIVGLLQPYAGPQTHVMLEEAQAMPGQGVRSMFTTGLGFGVWLGILGTLGLAYTRVYAPWSGSAAWGSPGTKNKPGSVPSSSFRVPISDAKKIMVGRRRCSWPGMVVGSGRS
jgi:hypothetical protein